MKFTKWTVLRLLALCLTVTFVWCWNYDRLTLKNWAVPFDYHEDTLMVMGWIQAAAEGDLIPFLSKAVHRLGAPYSANWNDWPIGGEEIFFGAGLLAKCFGLMTACNLAVLIGYLANAVGFYACCRALRFRREWAFVGAVLFAFTYFHAYRNLHHLLHTYSHTVPFAILTAWMVAFSRRMKLWDWRAWICVGTAVVMGLSNPYNLNMFGQLLCLALAAQWFTQRRKPNLQVGILALALIVICFLAMNLDTFAYRWSHGKNADAIVRGYYESELFALKPMELAVPPTTHKIAALAKIGGCYVRDAWIKGEMFSPYLGAIGIAGLLWMLGEGALLLLKRPPGRRRLPVHLPLILWVGFYAAVGGLNCIIAFAGPMLFRGTNRYSIFISALVLFFLVSRLSRLSRRWQRSTSLAVAAVALCVGLFDQLPQQMPPAETDTYARMVENDRSFAEAMESKLPPGTMVFQLPIILYPESTPVQGAQAYEHLRPWFFSKHLRFSFGSNKGRPREDWQKDMEKLPPAEMARALERYGFAALYINRKGYGDQGQGLLKQLADAGWNQAFQDNAGEQVCLMLKPSAQPELPPPGSRVSFTFNRGWVSISQAAGGQQCWAGGNASASFVNPDRDYVRCSFTCQVASMTSRRVAILLNGSEVWSATLGANQVAPVNLTLDAKPGSNRLRFTTDVIPRPSKYDPVPRAFVVMAPKLQRAAGSGVP